MFCCDKRPCGEHEVPIVNAAADEPNQYFARDDQLEMFLDLAPPLAEPFIEPEPAKPQPAEPEPATPQPAEPEPATPQPAEPPAAAPGTFVVEVEKKPGDDTVGLNVMYAGGIKAKAGIIVMVVNSGLIQTYNETAAAGQIVAAGNHIIEVNGVTTPADDMLAAIAKDTKLRIVFKAA